MKAHSKITANYASRAQGVHGSGGRTYKPEMADRILAILLAECVGPDRAITVEGLATRVGLNGRAVRQCVGDLELAGCVLTGYPAHGESGYFVCQTTEQAESLTRRLESQIGTMQKRVDARRKSAQHLLKSEAA